MRRLEPFFDAPPPPPTACACCNAFRAECLLPVGEGAIPACWLCAHAVAEHECAPSDAYTHECECLPGEIYPEGSPMSLVRRKLATAERVASGVATERPQPQTYRIDAIMLVRYERKLLRAEASGDAPTARAIPSIASDG